MIRLAVSLYLLSLVAPNVLAAQQWQSEPTSFFGLKFGAPLAASMPECQLDPTMAQYHIYKFSADGPECYKVTGPLFEIDHVNMFYPVYAELTEGNVSFVQSSIKTAFVGRDYDALVLKFGRPTQERVEDVRSKAGVAYKNRISEWKGNDVNILFETIGSRVDEGLLTVTTKAYRDSTAKQGGSDIKKAADSF